MLLLVGCCVVVGWKVAEVGSCAAAVTPKTRRRRPRTKGIEGREGLDSLRKLFCRETPRHQPHQYLSFSTSPTSGPSQCGTVAGKVSR